MTTKSPAIKKLYRSETERILGGVCGGLGDFFNLDPSLIRLVFVVLAIAGGSGLPLYLVLWVILPNKSKINLPPEKVISENAEEIKEKTKNFEHEVRDWSHDQNYRQVAGIVLLAVGMLFLLRNLGYIQFINIGEFWPMALVCVGLLILLRRSER